MRAAIAEMGSANFSDDQDSAKYSRGGGFSQLRLRCRAPLGKIDISQMEEFVAFVAIAPIRTLLFKGPTFSCPNGLVFPWAYEQYPVPIPSLPYSYLANNSRVWGYRASMEGALVSGKLTAQAISGSQGSTVGSSAATFVG